MELSEMKKKEKRVYVLKGDVYCVEIDNTHKCYFQYVARDVTLLSSIVIRVFKKKYRIDEKVDLEDILNGDVDFFAHIYLIKLGIEEKYWYKVGRSKKLGDVDNIYFKMNWDFATKGLIVSHDWCIWKINDKRIDIGDMSDIYKNYNIGYVFSPYSIYYRIVNGKWQAKKCYVK